MVFTDTKQSFDVTVENSQIIATYDESTDPDAVVRLSTESFAQIYASEDPKQKARELYQQGEIEVVVRKDSSTMILKGYKVIYDAFMK